jgi:hypothetical protein
MKPNNICEDEDIIKTVSKINNWLSYCNKEYKLECHLCDDIAETNEIYKNLTIPSKCPDEKLDNCDHMYVYLRNENKQVLSYIGFKIFKKPILYIDILWGCTDKDHRRKGLSTIILMIPVILALDLNIGLILSDSNELSGPLLEKKFGFIYNGGPKGTGEYIEELGNLVEWQSSPTSYIDLSDDNNKKKTIRIIKELMKKCN